MQKIIRTICYFTKDPSSETVNKLKDVESIFKSNNYLVQTIRICSPVNTISSFKEKFNDTSILLGIGSIQFEEISNFLDDFINSSIAVNIDISKEKINANHTDLLFQVIKEDPKNTFNFAYTFNNVYSSPYFPSARYEKEGFSIGLQPTDLSENCSSLEEWFCNMKSAWNEIIELMKEKEEFLGIDSSVAPLYEGKSSIVNFIKRLGLSFDNSVISDSYLKITKYIKEHNPKPIGLCGLMIPCLEDFELAQEYEMGNFDIERNIFLSLHSGLGIDVYPIGIDEDRNKVMDILKLMQWLSNKYNKPLSVRFVSDGRAKIGDKTNFQNQYLKDVVIRKL